MQTIDAFVCPQGALFGVATPEKLKLHLPLTARGETPQSTLRSKQDGIDLFHGNGPTQETGAGERTLGGRLGVTHQRLSELLDKHDFDAFVERECEKFYAPSLGRPSLTPGIYFRSLLVRYFRRH